MTLSGAAITRRVSQWSQRLLLGMPLRPFAGGAEKIVGRTQTKWGRWWDRHPIVLRCLAFLAIGWMTAYLVWRIGWSMQGASPWLGGLLLVAEAFGFWNLVILTWFSWRISPSRRPTATVGHTVDVYVCTYDEPVSVLQTTLAGCAALKYPHTTYLLDDGRRPEIAELAREWGAE